MSDDQNGHHVNYKKIYFILLGLLVVSVAGPFVGVVWITLVTAFGIAVVKANLVIQNFMHLKWEKRLMKWLLGASLLLMAVMVAGVAPDIMNHEGNNWDNLAAKAATERGIDGEHAETTVEGEPGEGVAEAEQGEFSAQTAYNGVCAACHGQSGAGDGPAGMALDPAPANFTDPEFWATRDEQRIVTVIRDGAVAVGGSPLMVPWRSTYSDEQIQALAEYVMTFRPAGQ
jgi:caa(3)-type oxidase subunit IV